ncbi:MAG: aldo/keto reductase [Planctomycetota bacterium]
MEKRQFGRTDMQVTALGFGGAEVGSEQISDQDAGRLLKRVIDAGINVIDTAACYGRSEVRIGQALADRRDEFYLFSKCGHARGLDEPPEAEDWDLEMMARSIEQSLQRLKTDTIDLMQLHTCSIETLKKGDVIEPLARAKEQGKIRYLGYSGNGETALAAIESGQFQALQTSANLIDQDPVDQVLPKAGKAGMGTIIKRPIANAAWLLDERPDSDYMRPYYQRCQEIELDLFDADEQESVEIALRFILFCPGVSTAIVGTRNEGHFEANLRAANAGPLAPAQLEAIYNAWQDYKDEQD